MGLDPQSPATGKIMKKFNADLLYLYLCRKQACFRARLTPKPSRIGLKTPKCIWPRDAESNRSIQEWVSEYEIRSRHYSACRILETIGTFHETPAVVFHDQRCQAASNLKLA
jgi:hypothetical protein